MHAVLANVAMRYSSTALAATSALAALLACVGAGCSPRHSEQGQAGHARDGKSATRTTAAQPAKVNLDDIFPPGRGRALVLNNCTTCHTFVPIVVLQMTSDAWERNSRDHRERVKALNDADFGTLYEYLKANFNPNRPVPKLPQALLETWTAY
jgi:hypothetical protein